MTGLLIAAACLAAAPVPAGPAPADWAEFRGPDGTGRYAGPALVTEWGVDTNVAWKTPVPGRGWSSPILVGGKLYLTTAVPVGDGDKPDRELRVLCVDAGTGKIVWNELVFVEDGKTAAAGHKKNSHASATPVSDGKVVFAHFGPAGTACLDLAGKTVWKTQKFAFAPVHGNGGSPILANDVLVFNCDGKDKQEVVALDVTTGEAKWVTPRKMNSRMPFSFATPHFLEAGGRKMIVSPASDFVAAYDPKDGAEIWRAKYPASGWSVITRPVVAAGLVVIQTGYPSQNVMAIDPAGSGDITTSNVKWLNRKLAPNTPTPVADGDDLYVVSDQGMCTCFDAKSGTIHWSERLKGKAYSASPILANGLLYVTSEEGTGQVLKAGRTFQEVSQSELKEKTFATFVPAAGGLYVRTETLLYKFAK